MDSLVDRIRPILLSEAWRILPSLFPAGRWEGKEYVVGDLNGNKGRSLKINPEKNIWQDFATGERGDLIDLIAHVHYHGDLKTAIRDLARKYGIMDEKPVRTAALPALQSSVQPKPPQETTLMPAPIPVPHEIRHTEFGTASHVWHIKDSQKRLLHLVVRFDTPTGKHVLPMVCIERHGQRSWVFRAPPSPRPLYGLDRLADNPNLPVIICEGEKAADAAQKLWPQLVAVSWTGGVHAIPKADWSPLTGRRIIIFPDNDKPGLEAVNALINAIPNPGKIKVVDVSDLPPKADAADIHPENPVLWLKERLIDPPSQEPVVMETPEPEGQSQAPAAPISIVIDPNDPVQTARIILENLYTYQLDPVKSIYLIRLYRGVFYRWSNGNWRETEEIIIRASIYIFLEGCYIEKKEGPERCKPNPTIVNGVIDALKAFIVIEDRGENPPFWIDPTVPCETLDGQTVALPPADKLIPFRNGLYDLNFHRLIRNTPNFFSLYTINVPYEHNASPPKEWLTFLNDLWGPDSPFIAILQEMMGLFLTSDTSFQKAFLLLGPPRSGKGTIARVISAMFNNEAVASLSLHALATQFGLFGIEKSPVTIIPDARITSKSDVSMAVERLLSITGEDKMHIERKYLPPVSATIKTRFLIISNEMPIFRDASSAIASRFIHIQTYKSFLNQEDRHLTAKLLKEIQAITMWAFDGLARLYETGKFTYSPVQEERNEEMIEISSPLIPFLNENLVHKPGAKTSIPQLYNRWKDWCAESGMSVQSIIVFARNVRAAAPHLKIEKVQVNNERTRFIIDYDLAPSEKMSYN